MTLNFEKPSGLYEGICDADNRDNRVLLQNEVIVLL